MVFHWVNSSLGSPVDRVSKSCVVDLDYGCILWELLWSLVSKDLLVLIVSPGREHVVANGEGVLWIGVDFSDLGVLLLEKFESEVVFFFGSVGFSVLCNVLDEGFLDGGEWSLVLAEVSADPVLIG